MCVCVGGGGKGGVRLYFMWFPGVGGSLDLNFVRRGGGVI